MARLRAPTHVLFLGGAGTKIGKELRNQEWFFEALLTGGMDNAPEGEPSDFHTYFINTDTSETPESLEADITRTASGVEARLDEPLDIDIDATVIDVGDIDKNLLHPDNVINESYIPSIMRDLELKSWWLEAGETVDSLQGLKSQGVNRKRGLTKAIHRLGQSDSDPIGNLITDLQNFDDDPRIAVVVGLGGGTGAGLLTDLAYRIQDKTDGNLTLFASLPAPSGSDKTNELANAYATLSELEYLELNERKLFETMHLLPFDAASDEESFNKSVIYALLAWYNINDAWDYRNLFVGDDDNGPPQYAPFTLTVPQYVRYVTEDVVTTEDNVEDFIEKKKKSIETEESLIETLEEEVVKLDDDVSAEIINNPAQPPTNHQYGLDKEAANDFLDEIEKLRDLLGQAYMRRIGYQAPEILHDEIQNNLEVSENEAEWDRPGEQRAAVARHSVELLPATIGGVDQYRPEDGWTGDEEALIEACIKQFELLKRRSGLYRAANGLEIDVPPVVESRINDNTVVDDVTSAVADDIREAISPEDAGRSANLIAYIEQFQEESRKINDEISTITKVIEGEGSEKSNKKAQDCLTNLESELRDYYNLFENREDVISLLNELESEIASKVNVAIAVNQPDQLPESSIDFDSFEELERACEDHDDITAPSAQKIKGSVSKFIEARRHRLDANNVGETPIGQLKETIRGIVAQSQYESYKNNYKEAEKRIDNSIIELPDWDESWAEKDKADLLSENYFDAGVDQELEDTRRRICEIVESALEDSQKTFSDEPADLQADDADKNLSTFMSITEDDFEINTSDLESWLEEGKWGDEVPTSFNRFKEQFEKPVEKTFETVLLGPFKQKLQDLQNQQDDLEETIERLEAIRDARMTQGSNFHNKREATPDTNKLSVYESPGAPGEFKNEIEPENEGYIGNNEDLGQADVFGDDDERENLIDELENLLPDYGKARLPLRERTLTHSDGNPYDGHVVNSVFLSPGYEEYRDDNQARIEEIWENLKFMGVDENDYGAAQIPFGDDHDMAMTTFLGGIFLDNLPIVVNECRDAYEQTMGDSLQNSLEDAVNRHVHLDKIPGLVERQTYALDGLVYHTEKSVAETNGGARTAEDNQFLPTDSDGGFPVRIDTINVSTDEGKRELLAPSENELVQKLRTEYYKIIGFQTSIEPDADQ